MEKKQTETVIKENTTKTRYFNMDFIRVIACFMVIHFHAGEYFAYDSNEDGVLLNKGEGFYWQTVINGFFLPCVPLFVMMSGYLLLPIKKDFFTFLKTRMQCIIAPFIFWGIFYAFLDYFNGTYDLQTAITNAFHVFVNYGTEMGHLWYMYMLIGLYFVMPFISPWVKEASKGQFYVFFALWLLSSTLEYVHMFFKYFWGECSWNVNPTLYYFRGYIGYVLFGAFAKKYLQDKHLFFVGLIMYLSGYFVNIYFAFKLAKIYDTAAEAQGTWLFHIIQTIIQSIGFFFMLKDIKCKNEFICKIFSKIAEMTFGMYLIHMVFEKYFIQKFDAVHQYPPLMIFSIAILTFPLSFITIKLISYLPFSHLIIG